MGRCKAFMVQELTYYECGFHVKRTATEYYDLIFQRCLGHVLDGCLVIGESGGVIL